MEKHNCKANLGFTLIEIISVLFIVSILVLVISFNPIRSYERYKERIAVNEIVSDIYLIQSKSLASNDTNYIYFFENANEYQIYYDSSRKVKKIGQSGKSGTGEKALQFRYRNGNVNIANTVLVKFKNSSYKIVVNLETGYVRLEET
ncbi:MULTISPECIES: prepilin-type N-terminal cleavage/methylation domain-containing protein [unclassified Gemella]|uniref:prepilin-type N-terminal cleavage/methylation domain-containing protein n=1 Tax=unclassified Gemella TaxID=2624949 RepID=UPI00107382AD|nr:prepilin-type N-terminal cleavage/methylation domain-containing protein [Gemella sp. GL1.1]MBF0747142.1 prepilin-type N-terminal cleavage/methylation domain-containing protein [Gemella sp. 19428wG2_WT2a]NYS27114.1 prepilin-type N-terminal cleavage/methylation domain-containing protein [Gemella sp. GL1]TFU58382.1 prepilin-type N-terminal cleavage/methylation domain-containing protein [Gemella sp. WT2a]